MGRLFLPFTPKGRAVELIAIDVKARLGLGPAAAVDPFAILPRVPARLIPPEEFRSLCPAVAALMFGVNANEWSGIGYGVSPADGKALILLNPTQAPTRHRATLMEEIVHLVQEHPKTVIRIGARQAAVPRTYNEDIEDEAFTVGAACLLPYPALFAAIHRAHDTIDVIAARYGVSPQYVEFRIKRAGLIRIYRKHCLRPRRTTVGLAP